MAKEKFSLTTAIGISLATLTLTAIIHRASCRKEPTQNQNLQEKSRIDEIPTEFPETSLNKSKRNLEQTLLRHEGKRNWAYKDTKGIKTIGIGFNLEKADARERIENLGLKYENIRDGKQPLTDKQIDILLQQDIQTAKTDARKYFGNGFDALPSEAQEIIENMAYNLGYTRLKGFKNLKDALKKGDYQKAAYEMKNSKWYNQVGNRSKELVRKMKALTN